MRLRGAEMHRSVMYICSTASAPATGRCRSL